MADPNNNNMDTNNNNNNNHELMDQVDDEDDLVLDGYLPEKVEVQNLFMELLQSNPSLEAVQDAYRNNPDVLLYSRGDCYLEDHQDSYPLHVACRESSNEIVAFLAKEFPQGLKIVDEHGYVPLHWAAERRSSNSSSSGAAATTSTTPLSIETFELLIDLYPEALICQDHENHSPLSVALLHDCSMDVLTLMIRHFPQQARELKILLHDQVQLVLTLEQTQQLVKLLPQMETLELEAYHWTTDAFLLFLEHLRHNTSIEKVTSLTLPMDVLHNHPQARQALQNVLQENTTIRNLHLTICDHDYVQGDFAGADDALLQSLQDGLSQNTTLVDLKLNHISLSNIDSLCQFLLSPSAPPILHLYSVEILGLPVSLASAGSNSTSGSGSDNSISSDTNQKTRKSPSLHKNPHAAATSPTTTKQKNRITSLDIENPLMSNDCLNQLLHQIPTLPHLERLRLSADALPFHDGRSAQKFPNQWQVTEALVNIVNDAPQLRHLNIRKPYRFKLGLVCKALQSNKTLHDFWSNYKMNDKIARVYVHVLKSHNATLQTLSPAFSYHAYPKLQYYLQLNQNRRAQARNPETCIRDFLPLLDRVAAPLQQQQQQQHGGEEDQNQIELTILSLRYGLLRECPGLWSGPTNSKQVGGSIRPASAMATVTETSNKKRRLDPLV